MTLVVRDEADIIDAHIRYHLAFGVDFVVATDHASTDGTREILEGYANRGVLQLLRESGNEFRQSEWVTRMARAAAIDHGADWVINSDADEFWWPLGGDLKQALAAVPERYGIVQTFVRPFLPLPGDGPFAERLVVRLAISAPINDPGTTFRGGIRFLHRASPRVVVATGNSAIRGEEFATLRGWSAVEVLHFPIRTSEQLERKFVSHYNTVGGRRVDHGRVRDAASSGRLEALVETRYADVGAVQRGLRDGLLVVDTRLRDALRILAAEPKGRPESPRRTAAEDVRFAVESAAIDEAELVRLCRAADELERRVGGLERSSRL